MTVLRSRETSSAAAPETSKPLSQENAVVEPATPSKAFKPTNQSESVTTTPTSSSAAQELGLMSGDTLVSGTGTVRRRSARIAGKLDNKGCLENIEVVSAKRKKVKGNHGNVEGEVKNSEGEALDLKLVTEDFGGGCVAESGLGNDTETLEVATVSGGRRKRKPSMEPKSLGFEENEAGKKFMGLRSGKQVVMIEIEDGGRSSAGTGNSKESCSVSSGDNLVEATKSGTSEEEDEKDHLKEKIGSSGDKGKGKVHSETKAISDSLPFQLELDDSSLDASNTPERIDPSTSIETGVKTRGRLSREEKGKTISGVPSSSSKDINIAKIAKENEQKRSDPDIDQLETNEALPVGPQPQPQPQMEEVNVPVNNAPQMEEVNVPVNNAPQMEEVNVPQMEEVNVPVDNAPQMEEVNVPVDNAQNAQRERFRNHARRNAARFALFSSQQELGNNAPDDGAGSSLQAQTAVEDWPGPFNTAMKIIKDRGANKSGARHGESGCGTAQLKWIPKKRDVCKWKKQPPSLQDLCLSVLSKNADAISSLDFVPDALRHKVSYFLCDGRRMNGDFLELLVHNSPTEIRIRDCSWLTEELVTKIFEGLDASKLMVFQFDLCGSCMPDYTLHTTLAHSPNCLPALTTISLKGAYRLQDTGLSLLASAAPSLKSIDISQCPLLTSEGITGLLKSLRLVLRELYLDHSHGVDAMLILPALLELESLEVLSLAGIPTVCDDFVNKFVSVKGSTLKELILADCVELTDLSLEVIGAACSELRAVDLSNLCKLTDISIGHLANGCCAIDILKLCRNEFSDEAIAAYLDVRGSSLKDLSLNNIIQVSNHTALSLARNCSNLRSLDLSWCRMLTNEALGLIVDSCSQLEVLKLFGCTQVTNVFLDGHSNHKVKLVGLKMTPIMKHIDVPDFLQGPLRYSC